MTYCPGRSTCSCKSCSPYPWGALRNGIRLKVHPMNAYNMLSMGCAYTGASAPSKVLLLFLGLKVICFVRLGDAHAAVAAGHVKQIMVLAMLQSMDLHQYFYCYFSGLKIKNPSLIKTMFPLHVFHCLSCKYFCSLEASSLEEFLEKCNKNNKNEQNSNMIITVFGASGWGPRPGWPLPAPTLKLNSQPPRQLYMPFGHEPGGFSWLCDSDCNDTIPAEVTCEECFLFINFSGLLVVHRLPRGPLGVPREPFGIPGIFAAFVFDLRAPQGSLGTLRGSVETFEVFPAFVSDPWAPQGSLGTLGVFWNQCRIPLGGGPPVPVRSDQLTTTNSEGEFEIDTYAPETQTCALINEQLVVGNVFHYKANNCIDCLSANQEWACGALSDSFKRCFDFIHILVRFRNYSVTTHDCVNVDSVCMDLLVEDADSRKSQSLTHIILLDFVNVEEDTCTFETLARLILNEHCAVKNEVDHYATNRLSFLALRQKIRLSLHRQLQWILRMHWMISHPSDYSTIVIKDESGFTELKMAHGFIRQTGVNGISRLASVLKQFKLCGDTQSLHSHVRAQVRVDMRTSTLTDNSRVAICFGCTDCFRSFFRFHSIEFQACALADAYAFTCVHTRTHMRTRTHTYAHAYTCACTRAHACAYTHPHMHAHACIHTRAHAHTDPHAHTLSLSLFLPLSLSLSLPLPPRPLGHLAPALLPCRAAGSFSLPGWLALLQLRVRLLVVAVRLSVGGSLCFKCCPLPRPCWPPLPPWLRFGCACCRVRLSLCLSVAVAVPPESCTKSCFFVPLPASFSTRMAQEVAQLNSKTRDCNPCCLCYKYSAIVVGGEFNRGTGAPRASVPQRVEADDSGSRYRPLQSRRHAAGHKRTRPLVGCHLAERRKGLKLLRLPRGSKRHYGVSKRWRFGKRPRVRSTPTRALWADTGFKFHLERLARRTPSQPPRSSSKRAIRASLHTSATSPLGTGRGKRVPQDRASVFCEPVSSVQVRGAVIDGGVRIYRWMFI